MGKGRVSLVVAVNPGDRQRATIHVFREIRAGSRLAVSKWNALSTEAQERIIGRTKIVRDNMPFGDVGRGEFGTYFIGYARSPGTIEQMLENMFIGRPPGNYDRLLDFSRAVTGNLFFVPTLSLLESMGSGAA